MSYCPLCWCCREPLGQCTCAPLSDSNNLCMTCDHCSQHCRCVQNEGLVAFPEPEEPERHRQRPAVAEERAEKSGTRLAVVVSVSLRLRLCPNCLEHMQILLYK